jgi:hypothetical protein
MSRASTRASTSSPRLRILLGFLTRLVQLISETWIQAFDPFFQFNKGAVVGQAHHFCRGPAG